MESANIDLSNFHSDGLITDKNKFLSLILLWIFKHNLNMTNLLSFQRMFEIQKINCPIVRTFQKLL